MAAGAIIIAAQAALTVASSVSSARAETKAARYQADIVRQQADYQRLLSENEAAKLRRAADRALGQQAARLAAAGQDLTSGSALLAQQSLAGEAEMEALRARNAGLMSAYSQNRSADLTIGRAKDSARQTYFNLGSRFLGGANKFSGMSS